MRQRWRGRRRAEEGQATVETVGMTILAAALVVSVAILALPQAQVIRESFSYAICQVVTFGQGSCQPPSSTPDAHKPTEPCVVASDGIERNSKVSVIVVTAKDGKTVLVQQMSDGTYRVTVTDTGGAGVETGVGGGLSVTVNDTTAGGNASASAGASLDINDGNVYYTDKDGLGNLMNAVLQDEVKDQTVGGSGPLRWLTDHAESAVGIGTSLPDPTETYAEGGISLNASAEATAGLDSASAGVSGATLLGVRTNNKDGSTTVYVKSTVSGEAGLQALGSKPDGSPQVQGVGLDGRVDLVNAVTFDSKGNMTSVQTTAAVQGGGSGYASALFGGEGSASNTDSAGKARIYQATLPIRNSFDQGVADNYLLTMGVAQLGGWVNPVGMVTSTQGFLTAAGDRGTITHQDYDADDTTVAGIDASGELGVELGVSASVQTHSLVSSGAEYWDGTQWTDWAECA